ncbi:MAG: methionine aminotransferase [Candidatus Aminicenantaceae bacterium]
MSENSKNLKSKLPHVGTTIFAVMSKLAHESGALNLSQGFPDFPVSPELIDRVTFYMKQGFNQYAPMTGVQPLREQICRKVEAVYGARYHPEKEINVTAGATQALYTAVAAVVHEGDEVILFSPAYDCYAPAVEVHGGIPVFSHLKPPGYTIDWDEVHSLINGKTRMIVVNTPHNPTGSILTDRDMRKLEDLTRGTDILVISDEVYEHIIFDGTPHQSAMLYPGLRERSFVVFSFGKTFHSTGWKMGYCLAPDELMQEFRSVHQFLVYCCNTPIQHAIADFLADDANYLGISPMYQAKRDLFLDRLKTSRFKFTPTSGSYFQLLDYSDITDEGDMDFAVRLTEEHKVASIPVSVFYPDALDSRVLRFCFAKREETLEKAAEILCRI